MKTVVYIDVLFCLNFFLDFVILYLTGRVARRDLRLWRLCVFSAAGAAYSCAAFFPKVGWMFALPAKLVFSAVWVMVSFWEFRKKELLKLAGAFYLVSFALGGTVFAMLYLTDAGGILGFVAQNGEIYLDIPAGMLTLSAAAAYALITAVARMSRARHSRRGEIAAVRVALGGKSAVLSVLSDTGSCLSDPLSGRAVLVAESAALAAILPAEMAAAASAEEMIEYGFAAGLRLWPVPYSAVGADGILAAFSPDSVTADGWDFSEKPMVALYGGRLSAENGFNALIDAGAMNVIRK